MDNNVQEKQSNLQWAIAMTKKTVLPFIAGGVLTAAALHHGAFGPAINQPKATTEITATEITAAELSSEDIVQRALTVATDANAQEEQRRLQKIADRLDRAQEQFNGDPSYLYEKNTGPYHEYAMAKLFMTPEERERVPSFLTKESEKEFEREWNKKHPDMPYKPMGKTTLQDDQEMQQ